MLNKDMTLNWQIKIPGLTVKPVFYLVYQL